MAERVGFEPCQRISNLHILKLPTMPEMSAVPWGLARFYPLKTPKAIDAVPSSIWSDGNWQTQQFEGVICFLSAITDCQAPFRRRPAAGLKLLGFAIRERRGGSSSPVTMVCEPALTAHSSTRLSAGSV